VLDAETGARVAHYSDVDPNATDDARRAIHMILGKPMGGWFWGAGVAMGHIVPLLLLATGRGALFALAAILALVGMGVIEWLWVSVPQKIPLS
jgi:hypothetical protein